MNDVVSLNALREVVQKRFKDKKKIASKVRVRYKENVEREYKRVIDAYYNILFDCLQSIIETLINSPESIQEPYSGFRVDDRKSDFINYIRSAFRKAKSDFRDKTDKFGLQKKIDKLGKLTKRLSNDEWKRVVQKTLGINILDDYYSGEFYREQLQRWTDENVNLISTLPDDALGEMQSIVEEAFKNGSSGRDMVKEIRKKFNASRSNAEFYAADQMAKLNAAITRQQQTECGVEEYVWSTSKDQRVRERHRELEGTTHRWDDPPIVDKKTGRRAHPGEDYRCRCVALPVFNLETLDIPTSVNFKQEK